MIRYFAAFLPAAGSSGFWVSCAVCCSLQVLPAPLLQQTTRCFITVIPAASLTFSDLLKLQPIIHQLSCPFTAVPLTLYMFKINEHTHTRTHTQENKTMFCNIRIIKVVDFLLFPSLYDDHCSSKCFYFRYIRTSVYYINSLIIYILVN